MRATDSFAARRRPRRLPSDSKRDAPARFCQPCAHLWRLWDAGNGVAEDVLFLGPAEIRKAPGPREGDTVRREPGEGAGRLWMRPEQLRRARALVRRYLPTTCTCR
jgi:hypothetical protein